MVIAVDFDGTIVEADFPTIGPENPGAFDWLHRFQVAGHKLILWTSRDHYFLTDAVKFCRSHGIVFDAVNHDVAGRDHSSSPKVFFDVLIDDKAVGIPLRPSVRPGHKPMVDWSQVGPMVLSR